MKYTKKLGEQFIDWNAAQNAKSEDGKVKFNDWRREMSRIRSGLVITKTSPKKYALEESPARWAEFIEMKHRKLNEASN